MLEAYSRNCKKMFKLLVFLVIFQFSNVPLSVVAIDRLGSHWILASDFEPSEIGNLNSTEEHRLLLKSLWQKRPKSVRPLLIWELLSRGAGIEFCGVIEDENLNRENTAIVRAALESLTKLQFQDQAKLALVVAFDILDEYGAKDLSTTFVRVCSTIDTLLVNETYYKSLVREYTKKDLWQPKKVYLSNIPKTETDFRKALVEFANLAQVKKIIAHLVFVGYSGEEETKWPCKRYVQRLAALPGEREAIQKIYDEAIQELVTQIKDISADHVGFDKQLGRNFSDWAPILYQILKEKMNANDEFRSLISEWETQNSTTTSTLVTP